MVYIHKETFDIIMTDLPRIAQNGDYFAADELIAPVIQALNRKGYITKACCAGHPFTYITEGYLHGDPEHKIFESRGDVTRAYILFRENIFLPTSPALPSEFVAEKTDDRVCINKLYMCKGDIYGFSREILGSMESLYEWVLELPDFNAQE